MQFREMIFFPRILEIISIEIEKKKKYDKFKRRLNFDREKKKKMAILFLWPNKDPIINETSLRDFFLPEQSKHTRILSLAQK